MLVVGGMSYILQTILVVEGLSYILTYPLLLRLFVEFIPPTTKIVCRICDKSSTTKIV
jgi:hypothetical protein